MRDVDALEQTVNAKWIAPAGSDTVSYGSDPKFETECLSAGPYQSF